MKKSLYILWIFLRTCLCYSLSLCVLIFIFLPALVLLAILPERVRFKNKLIFMLLGATAWGLVRSLLIKIHVTGRENVPQQQVVFIANHESTYDIPFVGYVVGSRMHFWYVWDRFFGTPVLGFLVHRVGVSVSPEKPITAARALIRGISLARIYGIDSIIFPEGGRYADGEVHDFFPGFAMIARKLRCPVVPIMLHNVGKVYPVGSFLIHPHPVTVIIGKPLYCDENETDVQFSVRARQWFVEHKIL